MSLGALDIVVCYMTISIIQMKYLESSNTFVNITGQLGIFPISIEAFACCAFVVLFVSASLSHAWIII
jgi:hypothetical protein